MTPRDRCCLQYTTVSSYSTADSDGSGSDGSEVESCRRSRSQLLCDLMNDVTEVYNCLLEKWMLQFVYAQTSAFDTTRARASVGECMCAQEIDCSSTVPIAISTKMKSVPVELSHKQHMRH